MKPKSIIFLIVSVALALAGLVTMRISEGIGVREGIQVVADTMDDGDSVFTYDFSEDSIGKISVSVGTADINIIGGADKPYIELVNFADGLYEFSGANRVLTVSDRTDLTDIDGIAAFAMNFKGLRGLVNYVHVRGKEKTVNIYLSEKYPVNIVSCEVESGNIAAGSSGFKTDYDFTVGTGTITVSGVTTGSGLYFSVTDGSVTISDSDASNLVISDSGKCPVEIISSKIRKITAETEEGDFRFGSRDRMSAFNLDLFTGVGSVKIDGENHGGYYETPQYPTDASLKITLGKGDIVLASDMQPTTSNDTSVDDTSADTGE